MHERSSEDRPAILTADVLRGITHTISIGTATAFVLSVIYEQAYFFVIGTKFETIASLSDYLTNVLDWLPAVAGVLVAYFIVVLAVYVITIGPPGRKGRSHRAPSSDEDAKISGDEKTLTTKERKSQEHWPSIAILFMGLFASLSCFLFDPARLFWMLGAASSVTTTWFAVYLLAFDKLRDSDVGNTGRLVLILGPPAVAFVFLWGLHHGYRDLNKPNEMYSLIREDSASSAAEKVNLLRVFERGILIRSAEQQINEFLRWDQVRSISLPRGGQAGKSFGCQQFGWSC